MLHCGIRFTAESKTEIATRNAAFSGFGLYEVQFVLIYLMQFNDFLQSYFRNSLKAYCQATLRKLKVGQG